MLKKLFAYVTLFAFFNQSCVEPALAVHPEKGLEIQDVTPLKKEFISLEKRDGDLYVLDYSKLVQKSNNALSLFMDQEEIATLMRVDNQIQWALKSNKKIKMKDRLGLGPFPVFDLLVDEKDCGSIAILGEQLMWVRKGEAEIQLKPSVTFNLRVDQEDVGVLFGMKDRLQLMGKGSKHLVISGLPELDQLIVRHDGPITFDTQAVCKQILALSVGGHLMMKEGFHVHDKGHAEFIVKTLDLYGSSMGKVILQGTETLQIHKGAKLEAPLMFSKGVLKALNVYGQLVLKACQVKEITTISNQGTVDLGSDQVDIGTLNNTGTFTAAFPNIKKAWLNRKQGKATITSFLQVNGEEFMDDGQTDVHGLALVNADEGRLAGTFSARKGQVSTKGTLSLSKGAKVFFQDHLTLRSGDNTDLLGNVVPKDFTNMWPEVKFSLALQRMYDAIPAGAYLSAVNHLSKKGDVKSNSNIVYRAKTYDGVEGLNRAGVFKGTISVVAENAKLADEMRSYGSATVHASNLVELRGTRRIDQVFQVVAKDLEQRQADITQAGVIMHQAENATMAGQNLFKQAMTVEVEKDFQSTETFVAKAEQKGALAAVSAKNGTAMLGGQYRDVTLQVEAKDIVEDPNFKGNLVQANLTAERIVHEEGSEHHVEGQGLSSETATQDITYKKGSSNKAGTNLLKAGNRISNSGSIESAMRYLGDCKYHYSTNGGRIKAPHLTIMADELNYNHRATLDGDYTEIYTLRNENWAGGVIRGRDALKINALQYNLSAPGSAMFSSNATINTALDLYVPFTSFRGPDMASLNGFAGSFLEPTYLISKGFNLAAGVTTGGWLLAVRAAQLAWQTGQLGYGLWKIYKTPRPEDSEQDYDRWSRRAKRWGDSMGLVYSAASTAMQATLLIGDYVKHVTPPQNITPPANTNQQPTESQNPQIPEPTNPEEPTATNPTDPLAGAPQEFKDKVEEQKQSATVEQAPWFDYEKYQNYALKYGKEGLLYYLGSSLEVNSILDLDFGITLAGHERHRSLFYAGYSPTGALTRDVSCLWGADYKQDWTYRSNITAFYDLSLGSQKHVLDSYRVHAGGDVHVASTFKADPTQGEVKADGKMYVANGAEAENVAFQSVGDMNFGGKITGGANGWVASTEGKATLLEGGEMNAEKNTLFGKTAETQAGSEMGGKESTVYGTNGALNNGTMQANTNQVLAPEGEAKVGSTGQVIGEKNMVRGLTAEMAGHAKGTGKEGGGDILHVQGTNGAKVTGQNDNNLLLVASEKGEATIAEGATNNAELTTLLDVNGVKFLQKEHLQESAPQEQTSSPPAVQENKVAEQNQATEEKREPYSTVASVWAKFDKDGRVLASNYPAFNVTTDEEDGDDRLSAARHQEKDHKKKKDRKSQNTTPPTEPETPQPTQAPVEEPTPSAQNLENLLRSVFPNVESITYVDGKAFITNPQFEDYQDFLDFFTKKGKYAALPFDRMATCMNKPIMFQQLEGYVAPTRREMASAVIQQAEERDAQNEKDKKTLNNRKISHDSPEYKEAKRRHARFMYDIIGLKHFYSDVRSGKILPENPILMSGYRDFMLVAPQIQVGPYLNVMTPGVFQFISATKPFILHEGSTVGAQIMNYIESPAGIQWLHHTHREWEKHHHHKYVTSVRFDQSTFMGGVGLPQDFENPINHTHTQRMVGLWLKTNGKAEGVGGNFISLGDIWIHATQGFSNSGRAQLVLVDYDKEKGWLDTSTQRKWTYDTEFLTGLISTPGMLVVLCEEGKFKVVGGLIRAGNGAYVIALDGHDFGDLMGRKGRIKERDAKINWLDSEHINMHELNETTAIVNTGNSPMYFWAIDKDGNKSGKTKFRGEIHSTEGGLTSMMGKKLYLNRRVLNHVSSHRGPSSSHEISLNPMLKAAKALKALKGLIEECNFEAFGNELKGMISPTAKIRLAFGSSKTKSQTLGRGSINSTYLFLDYNDIYVNNGFNVKYEEAEIYANNLYLTGVLLVTEHESTSFGLWASASGKGLSMGVDFNHTLATFEQLAEATFGGGKTKGHIGKIHKHGGKTSFGDQSELQVDKEEHKDMTPHSKVESYGGSIGVTSVGGVTGGGSHAKQTDDKGFRVEAGGSSEDGLSAGGSVKDMNWEVGADINKNGPSAHGSVKGDNWEVGADVNKDGPTAQGSVKGENWEVGVQVNKDGPSAQGSVKGDNWEVGADVNKDGPSAQGSVKGENWEVGADVNKDGGSATVGVNKDSFNANATIDTDGNVTAQAEHDKLGGFIGASGQLGESEVTVFVGETGKDPSWTKTIDLNGPGNKSASENTTANNNSVPQNQPWQPMEDGDALPDLQATDILYLENPMGRLNAISSVVVNATTTPESSGMEPVPALSAISRGIIGSAAQPIPLPELPKGTGHVINVGGTVIEVLDNPFMVKEGVFKYRIQGTNCYLENIDDAAAVIKSINELRGSSDPLVGLATKALDNPNQVVLVYDAAYTPFKDPGNTTYLPELGKRNPVMIATKHGDPHLSTTQNMAHELGGHAYWANNGDSYTPGNVPGNEALSLQNKTDLFQCYGEELARLGYQDLNKMPQGIYKEDVVNAIKATQAPWQYFVDKLKGNLAQQGIHLSDIEISYILQDAQADILKGKLPSARYTQPGAVQNSIKAAETVMTTEICSFLEEVSTSDKPHLAQKWFPETVGKLNELGAQAPTTLDGQPGNMHGFNKLLWFADYFIHVASQPGQDQAAAVVNGSIQFGADAVVYTPLFNYLTPKLGVPGAMVVGGVMAAGQFIPDYDQQMRAAAENMLLAEQNGDMHLYNLKRNELEQMGRMWACKQFTTGAQAISDFISEGTVGLLNEACPSFLPNLQSSTKLLLDVIRNDMANTSDQMHLWFGDMLPKAQPHEIKSLTEMWQDAMKYRDELIRQADLAQWKPHFDAYNQANQSDKGKEELE